MLNFPIESLRQEGRVIQKPNQIPDPLGKAERIIESFSGLSPETKQGAEALHELQRALEEARELGNFHRQRGAYIMERYDELMYICRRLRRKVYKFNFLRWNWLFYWNRDQG